MKTAIQNKSTTLVAQTNAEIGENSLVHAHRAAAWKLERRLHDIKTRAFEAESQARADYLQEIETASQEETE